MHAVIAVVFGLMVSAPVVAESLVEGWVRRSSGENRSRLPKCGCSIGRICSAVRWLR